MEITKDEALQNIREAYSQVEEFKEKQKADLVLAKKPVAEAIDKAKVYADMSIDEIAKELGVARQNLYKLLVDVKGVTHPNMIRNREGKNGRENE